MLQRAMPEAWVVCSLCCRSGWGRSSSSSCCSCSLFLLFMLLHCAHRQGFAASHEVVLGLSDADIRWGPRTFLSELPNRLLMEDLWCFSKGLSPGADLPLSQGTRLGHA